MYLELTLELCSTFHVQDIMTNFDDPGTIQFRLDGLLRQLSVPEFGIALGLYIEEFMDENDHDTLCRHIHYSPSKCWYALVPNLATYDPIRSKASALSPSLRYLHAILAQTLIGGRKSTDVSTLTTRTFYWPPDKATSEGGHLHWPLRDLTGTALRAPQHSSPMILPYSYWPDVPTRHLKHA
ncbi:hypothetical protein PVK06_040273 [Gossypium arboreum]|uniref:Uncharacterized protein n=1 Tax=Gossypium arboreum TaxID=29729 RepID=A0ABR0N7T8_GOSAR|nr:hypothetical protein PVK06_040273 [Gossypium arboreum]